MEFRNLTEADWRQFLCRAGLEGWRIPFQEQRLFQNQWWPSFFALHAAGELCGFVSAVAYKESGWIGNLLVPEERRGNGHGSALFDFAVGFLEQTGPKRIWLTASETGQPIYQRRGFTVIDRVERWVARGTGRRKGAGNGYICQLLELDSRCWGESRSPLLNVLADDGIILSCDNSIGLLQPGLDSWQLGPWLTCSRTAKECRQVLLEALDRTSAGKELLIDVLASAGLEMVLRKAGFRKTGSNQLMVKSAEPVALEGVLALASLGSIG